MSSRLVSTTLVLTTQGTKWELRKVEATFSAVVERLNERVFVGKRETFLMHQLKKLLSTEARKELRKNLPDHAAIVYSDYSKELALTTPENIKSAAFGASNCTIQLVPQVYEMTVLPPSAPQHLTHNGSLSFCSPQYNGGSRISEYEVNQIEFNC